MTKQPGISPGRRMSFQILREVLENGKQSHREMGRVLGESGDSKKDRAFAARLTELTLEHLITIDYALASVSKVPVEKMKPAVRVILRLSAAQLLYMDRVPPHAVCNEAAAMTRKYAFSGLCGFVNGCLRRLNETKDEIVWPDRKREPVRYFHVMGSLPEWLAAELYETYGEENTEKIVEAYFKDAPLTVRMNKSKASEKEILESLSADQVQVRPGAYVKDALILAGVDRLENLQAFSRGLITVQDESSMLVGVLAAPQKGDYVIDLCGAPGGKSLHAAELLGGTGTVSCRDLTEKKTALIQENQKRCGYQNMEILTWDAREYRSEDEERGDLVIADLPCSGLGVAGRKPEIKYRVTKEQISQLACLQREILKNAVRYVKPGGKLVFSTCTITEEENLDNWKWLLENFPLEPVNLEGREGLLPGFESIQGHETLKDGYIRLLPGLCACDGFFISVMRKRDRNRKK